MQYRKFGRHETEVSALGFGAMRLPILEGGGIDRPEAIRMLRHAFDNGVNYVDTAWGYIGGESETVVGEALRDGYRERVWVATKMPSWQVKKYEDFDEIFNRQCEKLQVDSIDCYLLHGLNGSRWEEMCNLGATGWGEKKKAEGKIRHFGFSFHDDTDALVKIVDAYDRWDFCQLQYNFMDVENQAGVKGLKYAAGKGLAVIIMEPLLGGKLASVPPKPVQDLWASASVTRTPIDWALQWLWSQPEVSLVLSGMSTFEQVEQNLASADASDVGTLSAEEVALVERVREAFKGLSPIPCTRCKYCLPCPEGVQIPRILGIYNTAAMYGDMAAARWQYGNLKEEERADNCVECGKCEDLCPQGIAIMEWLKKIHAELQPTG